MLCRVGEKICRVVFEFWPVKNHQNLPSKVFFIKMNQNGNESTKSARHQKGKDFFMFFSVFFDFHPLSMSWGVISSKKIYPRKKIVGVRADQKSRFFTHRHTDYVFFIVLAVLVHGQF